MNGLVLSLGRWQFAVVTIYHFFFVPLTLGLSIFVAIMETKYVTSGNELYKRMAKFWGKLFLINFAIGVATGLVQEFQFGMAWSGYSRFMGDIFGAPLAIEALLAFYIESTFLGVWIFGWNKLSKKLHAAMIWLVAIGSNLSALWILVANSFMQEPVGYVIRNGRAEMTNFFAVATNTHVLYQYPHVLSAGLATAGFVVLAISAYRLMQAPAGDRDFFQVSFRWAATYALIGSILVVGIGHLQGQYEIKVQPMKMAAAEALWNTESSAPLSLFSTIDTKAQRNPVEIALPGFLSFMSYNNFTHPVAGIKDLQAKFEQQYGPGNYIPNVPLVFWAFRIMVFVGLLMLLFSLYAFYLAKKGSEYPRWFLKWLVVSFTFPFIACSTGWIMGEVGRQPWIVYGLQKVADAISPNVSVGTILFSFISLSLLYAVLIVAEVYLFVRAAKEDPNATEERAVSGAY